MHSDLRIDHGGNPGPELQPVPREAKKERMAPAWH